MIATTWSSFIQISCATSDIKMVFFFNLKNWSPISRLRVLFLWQLSFTYCNTQYNCCSSKKQKKKQTNKKQNNKNIFQNLNLGDSSSSSLPLQFYTFLWLFMYANSITKLLPKVISIFYLIINSLLQFSNQFSIS